MTQPATPVTQAETQPATAPRRAYMAPRLTVHGTVESLTQAGGIGGGDASGLPDGG